MTTTEFKIEYDKIAQVYPTYFGNEHKERAIYSYIKDMDKKWWAALVNRIILSSNPKIDIQDAAAGERRSRKALELTRDMIAASDALASHRTENGLGEALSAFKANSLLDAVFKKGAV